MGKKGVGWIHLTSGEIYGIKFLSMISWVTSCIQRVNQCCSINWRRETICMESRTCVKIGFPLQSQFHILSRNEKLENINLKSFQDGREMWGILHHLAREKYLKCLEMRRHKDSFVSHLMADSRIEFGMSARACMWEQNEESDREASFALPFKLQVHAVMHRLSEQTVGYQLGIWELMSLLMLVR